MAYQGPFLKVVSDRVQTSSGKERTREYILHPGAALIIPVLDDGQLILERQYRHAVQKVFYEFPSGKIDPGEGTLSTAKRELKEETGYVADQWTFLTTIHPCIGYANEKIDLYLAEGLMAGPNKLDPGEDLEVIKMPLPELMQRVRAGEVSDVKTQIAAFWIDNIKKGMWRV